MAFIETRLLPCVAMGAQGGPLFSTDVVTVASGDEQRLQNWVEARHEYEIGLAARILSEFEEIKAAFLACRGRKDGFRFQDRADYLIAQADGFPKPLHGTEEVGTPGLGYGVPAYQLAKKYTAGSVAYYRDIRKPVSITLFRAAAPVTAGGGAGQYALSTTTGIITFVADQSRSISAHTVGADHILDLASAFSPNLAIGGRVYITGVAGTAADILNDLSHEVTAVAADIVTIATDTTGLTATGGNAFFYPQPTEALEFSGEFDVPVRFGVDKFDAVILDRRGAQGELILSLPSIPLIEIRT
jgi:uncharacterized protein (TIGR02217 family)